MKNITLTKILFSVLLILLINSYGNSQVLISSGTGTPDGSAMLEIDSDSKGILIPRMNTTNREAIAAVPGLLVYDTVEGAFFLYSSSGWVNLSSAEIWSRNPSNSNEVSLVILMILSA